MECFYCKGQMHKGYAPFSIDRNGYHIVWESVPAWVCSQCGEALFEEDAVNHIQQALHSVDRETATFKAKAA
jgi:YgiT-type zinc finger domain-containing protein